MRHFASDGGPPLSEEKRNRKCSGRKWMKMCTNFPTKKVNRMEMHWPPESEKKKQSWKKQVTTIRTTIITEIVTSNCDGEKNWGSTQKILATIFAGWLSCLAVCYGVFTHSLHLTVIWIQWLINTDPILSFFSVRQQSPHTHKRKKKRSHTKWKH